MHACISLVLQYIITSQMLEYAEFYNHIKWHIVPLVVQIDIGFGAIRGHHARHDYYSWREERYSYLLLTEIMERYASIIVGELVRDGSYHLGAML